MNIMNFQSKVRESYNTSKNKKENNASKSGTIIIRPSFNAARTLAQLANAKSKSQVSAIESSVRAQMQSMKRQGGNEQSIRQMKYVIQKTHTKRRALTKEQQIENNRKIAKGAKNKNQEARLTTELNRKRMSRMRRETVEALNSPDIFDKNKYDTYTIGGENQSQSNSIDIACSSFEVSGAELGNAIDTLL